MLPEGHTQALAWASLARFGATFYVLVKVPLNLWIRFCLSFLKSKWLCFWLWYQHTELEIHQLSLWLHPVQRDGSSAILHPNLAFTPKSNTSSFTEWECLLWRCDSSPLPVHMCKAVSQVSLLSDDPSEHIRAHSTRGISPSKPLHGGMSVECIFTEAFWSSSGSFFNFYLQDASHLSLTHSKLSFSSEWWNISSV